MICLAINYLKLKKTSIYFDYKVSLTPTSSFMDIKIVRNDHGGLYLLVDKNEGEKDRNRQITAS